MKTSILYFSFIAIVLLSCSKEEIQNEYNYHLKCDTVDTLDITDSAFYNLMYSEFKYYEGFYSENLQGASIYFENTFSINQGGFFRMLCTNDMDSAREWSEISANNSSYYRELKSESENEKYFQFRRERASDPNDAILSRVFKCSYFIDAATDIQPPNYQFIGTFSVRPIRIDNVLEFAEFYKFVTSYNWHGRKFIQSNICETNQSITVQFFETEFIGGDWGIHDQLMLYKSNFIVEKSTGKTEIRRRLLRRINGKLN